MTKQPQIGGVNVSAPLWHHATEKELLHIVNLLSSASYHYADDSTKEWGTAKIAMRKACRACAEFELGVYALKCLHRHTSQLVSYEQFVDGVMRARYERGVKDGYNEARSEAPND